MSRKNIVVLGTGGTIAGRASSAHDNVGYQAGQVGVGSLLEGLGAPAGLDVLSEQVAQVDSKDMSFEVWRVLALRCAQLLAQADVQGIVITHGTDTMEETAFFLQSVLAPSKPVVLTGAMRPASSASADGPQNLRDALAVAAAPGARGVVVVFAGSIHGALDVTKVHTYRMDPYGCGDAGPTGYVEEGQVRLLRAWPSDDTAGAHKGLAKVQGASAWPRVEIVMNYAGAGAGVVDALVAQGVHGLVAAGTGNGTLHADLETALLRAQASGVRVVRASRCVGGRVIAQGGDKLSHSHGLSPVKARIALMLELLS